MENRMSNRALPQSATPSPRLNAGRKNWRLVRNFTRNKVISLAHKIPQSLGVSVAKSKDYYSVQPVLHDLKRNRKRWDKPSALSGLNYDLDAIEVECESLIKQYASEVSLPSIYTDAANLGYGPGYPRMDAIILYCTIRQYKPARYMEVGSGLSTYFAWLAGQKNAAEGHPLQIKCVEPYPSELLKSLDIELIVDEAQNVSVDEFAFVESGDILFIDSSHALKIDSDVAYLFMEVVPNVSTGARIHVHDIPFPYNTPYPADTWIFGTRWPVFWQESLLLQAFLAFNNNYKIEMSLPLLRFHNEAFLTKTLPDYIPFREDKNPPSSIWLHKV